MTYEWFWPKVYRLHDMIPSNNRNFDDNELIFLFTLHVFFVVFFFVLNEASITNIKQAHAHAQKHTLLLNIGHSQFRHCWCRFQWTVQQANHPNDHSDNAGFVEGYLKLARFFLNLKLFFELKMFYELKTFDCVSRKNWIQWKPIEFNASPYLAASIRWENFRMALFVWIISQCWPCQVNDIQCDDGTLK